MNHDDDTPVQHSATERQLRRLGPTTDRTPGSNHSVDVRLQLLPTHRTRSGPLRITHT